MACRTRGRLSRRRGIRIWIRSSADALVKAVAGGDLLHVEGPKLKAELKADLAGPDPSPLERLLVERIVCCWILATYA